MNEECLSLFRKYYKSETFPVRAAFELAPGTVYLVWCKYAKKDYPVLAYKRTVWQFDTSRVSKAVSSHIHAEGSQPDSEVFTFAWSMSLSFWEFSHVAKDLLLPIWHEQPMEIELTQ